MLDEGRILAVQRRGVVNRILVVEMGMKIKTMGSTRIDREDLVKSAEPDNGYYIQNYALVADREVDLNVDPAPDLVVEVDITHKLFCIQIGIPKSPKGNREQETGNKRFTI